MIFLINLYFSKFSTHSGSASVSILIFKIPIFIESIGTIEIVKVRPELTKRLCPVNPYSFDTFDSNAEQEKNTRKHNQLDSMIDELSIGTKAPVKDH